MTGSYNNKCRKNTGSSSFHQSTVWLCGYLVLVPVTSVHPTPIFSAAQDWKSRLCVFSFLTRSFLHQPGFSAYLQVLTCMQHLTWSQQWPPSTACFHILLDVEVFWQMLHLARYGLPEQQTNQDDQNGLLSQSLLNTVFLKPWFCVKIKN